MEVQSELMEVAGTMASSPSEGQLWREKGCLIRFCGKRARAGTMVCQVEVSMGKLPVEAGVMREQLFNRLIHGQPTMGELVGGSGVDVWLWGASDVSVIECADRAAPHCGCTRAGSHFCLRMPLVPHESPMTWQAWITRLTVGAQHTLRSARRRAIALRLERARRVGEEVCPDQHRHRLPVVQLAINTSHLFARRWQGFLSIF